MHQAPSLPQPRFCSNMRFPSVSQTVVRPSFSCVSQAVNRFCPEAQALLAGTTGLGGTTAWGGTTLRAFSSFAFLQPVFLSHHSSATVLHLSSHVSCLKASAPSHPLSVLSNFLQAFVQMPFDLLRPTTMIKTSVSPLLQSSVLSFALVCRMVTNFFVPITIMEVLSKQNFLVLFLTCGSL